MMLTGITSAMLLTSFAAVAAPAPFASAAVTSQSQEAVKQGELLLKKLSVYKRTVSAGNIDEIDDLYDGITKQLSITEKSIGKVSGAANRKLLITKYAVPAKVEVERTIYEVSQLRLLYTILNGLDSEEDYPYDADMAKLERMKKRAAAIKQAGGYQALPASINLDLRKLEALTAGYNLSIYDYTVDEYTGADPDIYTADEFYDDLTRYLKQTEIKIGQVAEKSYRTELLNEFVAPAKVTVERTKYEISELRLMNSVSALIDEGKMEEAKTLFSKLEGLKSRAAAIKEAGGYRKLSKAIYDELLAYESDLKKDLGLN
ncbi:hypothetical protein [Bacillus sp. FJAT-42376]|uniref:hypothetical protein n=1 Tax=Bacillus sp. FJAT-42376 TaxID=2014076 RepID=UPI001F1526C0|nr:hypothetical protein [Bacillus sp. FJAT-42376]